MAYEYEKQNWSSYDEDLSLEENLEKGAVATAEKMAHMEEGIAEANKPYTAGEVTSVEAGEAPQVTVNEDKSIDFAIPKGETGAAGQSAYELWKSQAGNESKTETDFLASLVGENGQSAYELWLTKEGNEGKSEEDFLASLVGADGESAYEVWVAQEGNEGKTEDDFFTFLKGEEGDSAYEIWKAQPGNEDKTEEEFFDSLKGEKGEKGDAGEAFTIAKTYKSKAEMKEGFATDGVKRGRFVIITTDDVNDEDNAKLYVKSVSEYKYVTDLSGAQGIQGEKGADGQSAYELWKSQPGNESKTETDFLASLKGEKGDKGAPGAQGEKGEKGDPGVTFVKGASVETGAWVDQTGVFKAEVTVNGLVAGDMVVMNLGHDTYDVAKTAEVRPYTVCEDGKFAIYATTAPTATITIDYAVFKAPVA